MRNFLYVLLFGLTWVSSLGCAPPEKTFLPPESAKGDDDEDTFDQEETDSVAETDFPDTEVVAETESASDTAVPIDTDSGCPQGGLPCGEHCMGATDKCCGAFFCHANQQCCGDGCIVASEECCGGKQLCPEGSHCSPDGLTCDSDDVTVCEPGVKEACSCGGASTGQRKCDGSGHFEECKCSCMADGGFDCVDVCNGLGDVPRPNYTCFATPSKMCCDVAFMPCSQQSVPFGCCDTRDPCGVGSNGTCDCTDCLWDLLDCFGSR